MCLLDTLAHEHQKELTIPTNLPPAVYALQNVFVQKYSGIVRASYSQILAKRQNMRYNDNGILLGRQEVRHGGYIWETLDAVG